MNIRQLISKLLEMDPEQTVDESIAIDEPTGAPYVIVRTFSAGVFAGYLKSQEGKEVILKNARRLWYWKGAASLSQLAMEGVKSPSECKFPIEVDEVKLTEAIEILNVTEKAKKSIAEVPIWSA